MTIPSSASPSRARPTREDALRIARREWAAGRRVDISNLAVAVGVGRVTLHRWFGSRDGLLVELVWQVTERHLAAVTGPAVADGAERVVQTVSAFLEGVIASPGMRAWLAADGEHAMRLLTRRGPGFQPRLVAAMAALLHEEADAGRLRLRASVDEVAYVLVRLIESYTYLDLITGEEPDAGRAEPILRMLLSN